MIRASRNSILRQIVCAFNARPFYRQLRSLRLFSTLLTKLCGYWLRTGGSRQISLHGIKFASQRSLGAFPVASMLYDAHKRRQAEVVVTLSTSVEEGYTENQTCEISLWKDIPISTLSFVKGIHVSLINGRKLTEALAHTLLLRNVVSGPALL